MIDTERMFIFVHIPKTGGTSIESALRIDNSSRDVPFKHINIEQHMKLYDLNRFFKFSIVRDPFDITLSMYKYLWESNHDWPRKWRSNINKELLNLKFRDWIKHETFHFPSLRSVDVLKKHENSEIDQFAWIRKIGKLLVDFVGKFETPVRRAAQRDMATNRVVAQPAR